MLLDTHTLLWFFNGEKDLSYEARSGIEDARRDVHVSVVSLWEIVIKVRLGKLRAVPSTVRFNVERLGWTLLGVTARHLSILETLPVHHKDPFDHLLIAQAMAENLTLVTDDRHMRLYTVRTLPCSGRAAG